MEGRGGKKQKKMWNPEWIVVTKGPDQAKKGWKAVRAIKKNGDTSDLGGFLIQPGLKKGGMVWEERKGEAGMGKGKVTNARPKSSEGQKKGSEGLRKLGVGGGRGTNPAAKKFIEIRGDGEDQYCGGRMTNSCTSL